MSDPSSRSKAPPEYPYAHIVENIRAAIGISEKGLHRYGNRAYLDMFGYAANEELVGKPFMEQIAPDAREALLLRIAKRSDDVTEERYETMGFKKDGSEFPMEVLVSIVRNETGELAVAFFADISSEKQNSAAIRESAALLSAIVNSTSHYIWAVDAKSFGLTFFNEKMADYFLKKRGIRLELGMLPNELYANADDARTGIRGYECALAQGSMETDFTNFDRTLHLNLHLTRLMRNNEATGIAVFGEDVTQKLHAQRRLTESESLYRVLADNAMAGVYFVQDGKIAYANKTLAQMFDYENGELVGQDPLILFHPDDRSVIDGKRSRRAQGATEAAEYEARCLRKDGSIRQIFLSVSSAVYKAKPATIVLMKDITEAKKTQEELRRSEAMFRTLSENAMVGVYVLQDGKFAYVNKRLAEMFGYEPEELIGRETLSIIHPEDHAFAAENRQRRADGHVDDVEYEIRGVRKDKTTIILGVAASGADFLGKTAVIVVMRDITESKHVEESLRDSEARFRSLSENSLVGVYMSQNFKLAYVNRPFARIFERTPMEMIGLDLSDVIHPDDWQLVSESLQPGGDGELTQREFEVRILRADGAVRTVAATASGAVINGRPLAIGALRDITESKQAEQKLRESEAMFRTLSEDSMAGVYFSQDEKFAYANKTLANMFGYEPEELLGQNTLMLIHPDDRHILVDVRRLRSEGTLTRVEYEIRGLHKAGHTLQIAVAASSAEFKGKPAIIVVMRDITAWKKALDSLMESEGRFRVLSENSLIGVYAGQGGYLTYVNPTFAQILGYEPDELVGTETALLIHPDDRQMIRENGRLRAEGKLDKVRYETRVLHKDGSVRDIELTAALAYINGVPASVGAIRDITESKKALRLLTESEERFRALSDNSLVGVYSGQGGQLTYVNRVFAGILGYESEELVGVDLANLMHPDDRVRFLAIRTDCQSGKIENISYEMRALCKDGTMRIVELSMTNATLNGSLAIIGTMRDITESREAAERIRESEERFRVLSENAPIGVHITKNGCFAYLNATMAQIYGRDREEMLSRDTVEFVHPDDRHLILENRASRVRGEFAQTSYEFRAMRKDGSTGIVEVTAHPAVIGGEQVIIGTSRDVTENRMAVDRLIQSEERFRVLAQNAMVGVYISQDGNFIYANDTINRIFGYGPAELIGESIMTIVHPEDRSLVENNRRLRAEGKRDNVVFELRGVRRDGTANNIEITASGAVIDDKPAVIGTIRDITESKAAAERIRESEERFRVLSENALVGTFITRNGIIVYANTTYAQIFGSKADDLVGTDMLLLIHPDDRHIAEGKRFSRRDGDAKQTQYEVRALHGDGRVLNIEIAASDVVIDGQPASIGTVRDITQSKEAVERIRESEEQFRVLSENSLIGVYMARGMRITYANATFAEIFGYGGEELIGMELLPLIHPDDRQRIMALRETMVSGASDKAMFEARGIRKDKSFIYLDLAVSSVIIGNEMVTIGAVHDITDKHQAFESLRESEEFFRNSFENGNIGACLIGLDGRFLRVNERLCEIMGYSSDELRSMTFNDITYQDDKQIGADTFRALYRGKTDRAAFEKRYVHKTGRIVWCQLSVGIVHNREGKSLYFVTYIQDITEQKNYEQLIAQSNRQLQTAAMEAIECLGYVVETRDPYTSGHQRRVADLAAAIAAELGLPESQIQAVRVAGTVHDIGKMSIPAEILSKPTVLTAFERTFVQQHAESGYQILSRIHFPWPVAEIVYQHHESIDGSGYPRKLTGDAIMPEAKILCVADVVEAMSTHRPYRPALGVDAAMEEILRYAGIRYDIDAVNACVKLFMEKGYQLLS